MKPELFITKPNVAWVLNKTNFFEVWSWKEFNFDHKWVKWNERILKGHIKDLCFKLDRKNLRVETCFEEISWNYEILYDSEVTAKTVMPLKIRSSRLDLVLKENTNSTPPEDVNVYKYWSLLWREVIPDLDVEFKKITFKDKVFDFKLNKESKKLEAISLGYHLTATPDDFTLQAPSPYTIPTTLPLDAPLLLTDLTVHGKMSKRGVKLKIDGAVRPMIFHFDSGISFPVENGFSSVEFKKDLLLATSGELKIPNIKSGLKKYSPSPYKSLPAPLNEMDGHIVSKISTAKAGKTEVLISALTSIDLQSKAQALIIEIDTKAPLNLLDNSVKSINLELDFKRVALLLPRISKKSLPPQIIPDSRFHKSLAKPVKPKAQKKGPELNLVLEALNEKALHIKTNLLDEPLRLNFNLVFVNGEIEEGFVSVLPLETKVFKRPIKVESLKVTFKQLSEAVIVATVLFPLPEYKITLELEGPISSPRYHFSSNPPLPQSDIYAVLLFGRPMSALDPSDKTAAAKTNQVLSQGILSLSVLYFLAGSPVEYVGYNSESGGATAQFGLNSKTSISVGGSQEGLNSTGIRRSLGKGWYLDTSVQMPSSSSTTDSKNYGALIERIIAY